MRTIDELGISKIPWIVANDDGLTAYVYSDNGNGDEVSQTCYGSEDARLIAAAPELYKCLREAIAKTNGCDCNCEHCIRAYECKTDEWCNALAKASGEEANQ